MDRWLTVLFLCFLLYGHLSSSPRLRILTGQVAVNKSANEDKITNALDDLSRWYPRLNDLTDIYPEPKLEASVAEVYKGGIMFAQSSETYYTSLSGGVVILP